MVDIINDTLNFKIFEGSNNITSNTINFFFLINYFKIFIRIIYTIRI
jgi:hypothetical protein